MRYAELGLALFAGCVIGWWWGERPDVLRDLPWLNAMTAFGTVGATVSAVAIAIFTHRRQQANQLADSGRYARSNIDSLISITRRIGALALQARSAGWEEMFKPGSEKISEKLSDAAAVLGSVDVVRIGAAYPHASELIIDARITLTRAIGCADGLPGSSERCGELLGQVENDILNAWVHIMQESST